MSLTFEKVIVLKNVPLFSNVSEQALADLITNSEEKLYKAGDIILETEEDTDVLYIILSGTVHCILGSKVVLEYGPRQVFGETTVFNKSSFPYKIKAHEKTVVLKVDKTTLYRTMALYPSLAFSFLGNLSSCLHQERVNEIKKIEK